MMVYFVEASGRIKIGCSGDLKSRLARLRVESKDPKAQIVACFPGTFATEASMHRVFSRDRIEGEWFSKSEALMDFIGRVGISPIGVEANIPAPVLGHLKASEVIALLAQFIQKFGDIPVFLTSGANDQTVCEGAIRIRRSRLVYTDEEIGAIEPLGEMQV